MCAPPTSGHGSQRTGSRKTEGISCTVGAWPTLAGTMQLEFRGAQPPRLLFGVPPAPNFRGTHEINSSFVLTQMPTTEASPAAPEAGALPILNSIVPA